MKIRSLVIYLLIVVVSLKICAVAVAQTTYIWEGGVGTWTTAVNWTPVGVPGPLDTAIITTGTTVTANGPIAVRSLILNATLAGSGVITITESLNWLGGSMMGTGRTIIAAGGTMTVNTSATTTLRRRLDNGGVATILGGSPFLFYTNGILTNLAGGTLTVSGGSWNPVLGPQNHGVVNAGTFTVTGPEMLDANVPFTNTGAVLITGGGIDYNYGGSSTGGTMAVPSGTALNFTNSFLFSGGSINGEGVVNFTNGTYFFSNNFVLNSSRPLNLAGNLQIDSPMTIGILNMLEYSAITGSADLTITGQLNWTSGQMAGTGRTIIAPSATMSISAAFARLNRTLKNDGTILNLGVGELNCGVSGILDNSVGGNISVSAGSFNGGAFLNSGSFRKIGGASFTCAMPLINAGVVELAEGSLSLVATTNNGTISAASGTTLDIRGSGNHGSSSSLFGTGSITITFGTHVFPAGTLTPSGPLRFQDCGVTVNNALTPAGPMIFSGSRLTFNTDQNWPNAVEITERSSVITGTGNLTFTGPVNWAGGEMTGSGRTIIGPTGTLAIALISSSMFLDRTLDNFGSATISGFGNLFIDPGVVVNNHPGANFSQSGGVIRTQGSGDWIFNNAGTFNFTAEYVNFDIQFYNTGTVNIESGTMILRGGTPNYDAATRTFAGGTWRIYDSGRLVLFVSQYNVPIFIETLAAGTTVSLSGPNSRFIDYYFGTEILEGLKTNNGTLEVSDRSYPITPVGATLTNNGQLVARTSGVIAVTGRLAQTAIGTARFELGGLLPSQYGRITASIEAILAGAAQAAFVSPPYTPMAADTFPVISAPVVSGSFSQVCIDQLISGLGVIPVASPNVLSLVVSPLGTASAIIVSQPQPATACPVGVTLSVQATGNQLAYQWQRETSPGVFANLVSGLQPSGANITGASTDALRITAATQAEAGLYRVSVINPCGRINSNAALLTVAQPCSLADVAGTIAGPSILCGDSIVDGADFIAFINSFSAGDPIVDALADVAGGGDTGLSPDGIIDGNDFVAFINAFAAGC